MTSTTPSSCSDPGGPGFPDLLPGPGVPLVVLFCGINAPEEAVAGGEPFGRSNRFWPVLHGAGFTPRLLAASEYRALADLGHGITTLVERPTPRAADLTTDELRSAVPRLERTVHRARPRWVGFLGIGAFRSAFAAPEATVGPQRIRISGAPVWVLPNPSGLNRRWTSPALVAEYARLHRAATAGPGPAQDGASAERSS